MNKNKYYCRINGTIYNLSKVQDILDKKSSEDIAVTLCTEYGIDAIEALTFEEVIKFNNNQIPADYNEALERFRAYNSRGHEKIMTCPRCGSTNIKKLTKLFDPEGLLSVYDNSLFYDYTCQKCKYQWK